MFSVPLPPAAPKALKIPQVEELPWYTKFGKNDKVKVVRTLKKFKFALHAEGNIDKIVKDGKVHFCVKLDDPKLQEKTRGMNGTPMYSWHNNGAWLRCQLSHIELVRSSVSAGAAAMAVGAVSHVPAAAAHVAASEAAGAAAASGKKRKR